jgi:excisionase family DNA binding protein
MTMPKLLTTAEVSELLRLSPGRLLQWRRLGHIPAIVLPGGGIRYREEDVLALLERRGERGIEQAVDPQLGAERAVAIG